MSADPNTREAEAVLVREDRYVVIKRSDIDGLEILQVALAEIECQVDYARNVALKPKLKCVVVESDWPEYEPTWKAIEDRVAGRRAQAALYPPQPDQPSPHVATERDGASERVRALEEALRAAPPIANCNTPGYHAWIKLRDAALAGEKP